MNPGFRIAGIHPAEESPALMCYFFMSESPSIESKFHNFVCLSVFQVSPENQDPIWKHWQGPYK